MKNLALITLLLTCVSVNAQVYSYVDSNGNTIYTDNPPEGQETRSLDIQLTPTAAKKATENMASVEVDNEDNLKTVRLTPPEGTNALNTTTPYTPTASPPFAIANKTVSYQSLNIIAPTPEATIANTGGHMMVTVDSSPSLAADHKYQVSVDDKVVSKSSANSFSINGLERGEHKLIVKIIDANNTVLKTSTTQTFHIRQTTQADLRRINPCKYLEYGVREECPIEDRPEIDPKILRKITDRLGLTKPCDLPDYGVRKDCPLELKPKDPAKPEDTNTEAKEDAETK